MIKSIGEDEFSGHDSANIPCNIFITEMGEDEREEADAGWDKEDEEAAPSTWAKWQLTADIFMPRKGIAGGVFHYVSSTKEELHELVKEYILPSYVIALKAVTKLSEGKLDSFYYWEEEDD